MNSLINYGINLILTWSADFVISSANGETKFAITDTKLYVPIATGQEDDYTTGCLMDYNYFNKHYKMIAIDLRKKQALDAGPKAIQQINFTRNLA